MPASTPTARWASGGLGAAGGGASRGRGPGSSPAEPRLPQQILYARDVDQRSTTFEKSLLMGKEFQRRAKAMILRAAVLRNQIHVKVRAGAALGQGGARPGAVASPGLTVVSPPTVPSSRGEPGGADTSQQPVPNEHQHVRAPGGLQGHLHPPPRPLGLQHLGLPALGALLEVPPVAHLQGPSHWPPALGPCLGFPVPSFPVLPALCCMLGPRGGGLPAS